MRTLSDRVGVGRGSGLSFGPVRRLVILVAFAFGALAASVVSSATAGKAAPVPPLSLVRETFNNNPLPMYPTSCANEDDFDQRGFYGYLYESYSTSFRLCDYATDGFSAGGEGVYGDVYVVGQLGDLAITSPSGVTHHAVLVGSAVSGKGSNQVTTYHYQVCFVPPFSVSTGVGTDPLEGGIWTETLSGQIVSANQWTATAMMSFVDWQQTYCPPQERNLTP